MCFSIACHILSSIHKAGFSAFFVGGCVRDLLLQQPMKDIDIATEAFPEQIRAIFPKTIAVGEKFGVILVIEEDFSFEVSTFRKDLSYTDGRHPDKVVFCQIEEDAKRRDFTINGLFYDPFNKKIYDYVGGRKDLEKKIIRAIGNPIERFQEDRLRLLRAIRFSVTLQFSLESKTKKALKKESPNIIKSVSGERLWQEIKKMLEIAPLKALKLLFHYQILQEFFPCLKELTEKNFLQQIQFLKKIPSDTDPLLKLAPLFSGKNLTNKFNIFKLSKKQNKLIDSWEATRNIFSNNATSLLKWAYALADPNHSSFILIYASLLKEKKSFLSTVEKKKKLLKKHIERIQKNTLPITSLDLINLGISPGERFGLLLKEAEIISIEKNTLNKKEIFFSLKIKGLLPEYT